MTQSITPATTPPAASVTPPPAAVRPAQRPKTVKRAVKTTKPKKSRARTAQQAVRRPIRAITAQEAGPDTLLLVGGLALFVLVLADTVFLTLSRRSLRAG